MNAKVDALEYILNNYSVGRNAVRKNPMPLEIPDFTRRDLALLFKNLDAKLGVELGVADGKYSEVLCAENPQCSVYSVDPWEIYGTNPVHYHYKDDKEVKRFYDAARERLGKYSNSIIMKEFGYNAVNQFVDESLDFVYIDADHKLLSVVEDILAWSAKVRVGGIISGHDYVRHTSVIHVKEAVNAYTAAYNIRPWFVFGRLNVKDPLAKKDRERSWFWVKR